MSAPPTRCCVLTQRGTRCANEPSPVRPSRMIGPVRLAACGLDGHQRALWSLPGFIRHDAYCGAFGCDRPSNAGICQEHRDQYRDFGITEHMLFAQEAPMTEPVTPPAAPQEAAGVGATSEPHPLEIRRDALVARLFAAGFVESPGPSEHLRRFNGPDGAVLIPIGHPCEVEQDFANTLDHAEKECAKVETAKEHDYCRPGCGHDGEPIVPGPTVAELEAQLAAERARADAAERDAAAERVQANEALSQLHDARVAMKQVRAALFSALGVEPDDTSTLRLLAANHGYIRTLDSDYGKAVKEIGDAVHLFQLLGVKIGTLPDMITALLPRPRLLKLRIRNETAAALAIDNLSLQEVPEDDPRMVEAIRLHREATALRRAAEPDRATDAEKVQE